MKPYLFVYGTLRSEHPMTHRLLGDARFVAPGSISGTLYDLGKYPGVHRTKRRDTRVSGEVYELIGSDVDQRLCNIDRYEGSEFRRSRVLVQLNNGRRHRAWAYILADAPPHQRTGEGLKRDWMAYQLVPASIEDEAWLERLRRDVYQDLFMATFGGWDEAHHVRQFGECLKRGGISIIEVDGMRVGMIQLFDQPDTVKIGEIQVQPSHQNRGIGTQVLRDLIGRVHQQGKRVLLSVALKNERAYHLYQRLGFQKLAHNDSHNHMACDPQS